MNMKQSLKRCAAATALMPMAAAILVLMTLGILLTSETRGEAPAEKEPAEKGIVRMSTKEALEAVGTGAYGLAEGEDFKRILPPFPAERAAFVDAAYPYTRGSKNVKSLQFSYKDGMLTQG